MSRVQCYVYDITQGMAKVMSQMLVGKQVDIVPHTGIVVDGVEYFFGGGICTGSPGNCIPLKPCEIIDLGTTNKTKFEIDTWLRSVNDQWTTATYNLLTRNCNHFANELATFLGVENVPDRIVHIADEALSTPQGASIRQLIESFESGLQNNSNASSLNPFGNVSNAQASAPGNLPRQPTAGSSNPSGTPTSAAAPAAAETPVCVPAATVSEGGLDIPAIEGPMAEILKESPEKRRSCLSTLHTLAKNANSNRSVEKFTKVKMENPSFLKKVGQCSGGTEAMFALGFLPDTIDGIDFWVLQKEAYPTLSAKVARLGIELAKLGSDGTSPKSQVAGPEATAQAFPGLSGSPSPGMPNTSPFPGLSGGGMGGGAAGGMPMNAPFPGMGGMGMPGMGGMGAPQIPAGLAGLASNPMAQQMMANPAMMQQAQNMMQNNPAMMQQAQQMMGNPAMQQQMQQMMNDPATMQSLMQMMNDPAAMENLMNQMGPPR